MPIWTLEPLDLEDRNWEASTYKGQVTVRAKNERKARFLAAKAFGIATHATRNQPLQITPWHYTGAVSCRRLLWSSEYSEEGEDDILGPKVAILAAHPGGD